MENPRPEKVAVVDEVRERFTTSNAALLTEYRGLDVSALGELRRALRDAGGEYKIYKNTLVRFAAREAGLEIDELLTGPTAIAFVGERPDGEAGDEVLLAKIAGAFAAPMQQFAGLLEALPRNFAYGLSALIDKGGAADAPADAPVADAPVADAPPADDTNDAPADAAEPTTQES